MRRLWLNLSQKEIGTVIFNLDVSDVNANQISVEIFAPQQGYYPSVFLALRKRQKKAVKPQRCETPLFQ